MCVNLMMCNLSRQEHMHAFYHYTCALSNENKQMNTNANYVHVDITYYENQSTCPFSSFFNDLLLLLPLILHKQIINKVINLNHLKPPTKHQIPIKTIKNP